MSRSKRRLPRGSYEMDGEDWAAINEALMERVSHYEQRVEESCATSEANNLAVSLLASAKKAKELWSHVGPGGAVIRVRPPALAGHHRRQAQEASPGTAR